MEMSAGYYGPEGRRWMPQWYKKTLGDCPGSEMSMSFLEFGSCLLLFTYIVLYSSGVFDGLEEWLVVVIVFVSFFFQGK